MKLCYTSPDLFMQNVLTVCDESYLSAQKDLELRDNAKEVVRDFLLFYVLTIISEWFNIGH